MEKLQRVKKNKEIAENKIKAILLNFIEENGACAIEIETSQSYEHISEVDKRLVGLNLKMKITI